MARAALIGLLALAAGCTARDHELLPRDGGVDAGRGDAALDAGEAAGGCLGGTARCDACPPACVGCAEQCAAACAPPGACAVGLTEPVTGTLQCDPATVCGEPAGAYEYCRADQAPCSVNVRQPATVACLGGTCRVTCEAACDVECAGGGCTVRCQASPCRLTSCPVTVTTCPDGRLTCGAPCAS